MSYRFASLTPVDEPAITCHLLSLDAEDRALRFGTHAPDRILLAYAQSLNFNRDVVEGAWDGGRLVGLAHLAVHPEDDYPVGELGLSINSGHRRQHLGMQLIQRVLQRARRYRLTRMDVHYMRRNLAMARLVSRFHPAVVYHGDEAQARIELLPRAQSLYTETRRSGVGGRREVCKNGPRRVRRGLVLRVHGAGGDGRHGGSQPGRLRHALRQARPLLPAVRSSRVHSRLAGLIENRP